MKYMELCCKLTPEEQKQLIEKKAEYLKQVGLRRS
jgi:hypothetical protein